MLSNGLQCINTPDFHALSRSLGLGEQSCIECALQNESKTLLIIDDSLALKQALRVDLSVVGTAALLFADERKGLIPSVEHQIEILCQSGYRISPKVIELLKS